MKHICVENVKLPALVMGSSPFIGAGQFGVKSYEYYSKFYKNPDNIVELLVYIYEKGCPSAHLF